MKIILSIIFVLLSSEIFASGVFNITFRVGGSAQTLSYDSIEDMVSKIKEDEIKAMFPSYNPLVDQVAVQMDLRGVPATISYATGSTNLILSIPDIGVTQTFTGATRDDSRNAFKDWLKKDGGDALNKLMAKMSELSAFDPIAGNPNSLMSQMVGNDFDQAQKSSLAANKSAIAKEANDQEEDLANAAIIGAKVGSYEQNGKKTRTITLPMGYTINFKSGKQLSFFLPITYIQIGNAKAYNLSLGSGLTFPITSNWSLTPGLGYGVVGSIDLGSMGQIASGNTISNYYWKIGENTLSMTNMIGYYQTMKLSVKGFSADPKIKNLVARNGFLLSIPHNLWKWKSESEIFLIDTRYFLSKLYLEKYNELGLSIGSSKSKEGLKKHIRIGASYLFSSKMKGWTANFGYSF